MGRNSGGIRNNLNVKSGALTLSDMGLSSQDLHFVGLKRVQSWIKNFNLALTQFLTQGKSEIERMVSSRNFEPLRKVAQTLSSSYTGRRENSFQLLVRESIRQTRSFDGFLDAKDIKLNPQTIKLFASLRARQILISQYKRYL